MARSKPRAGTRAGTVGRPSRRRLAEAAQLLADVGAPPQQQNERSALTLLALAEVGPEDDWNNAQANLHRTVDVMAFIASRYRKKYAPNSRETFRRQTLHQFIDAGLAVLNPDDPSRPTNSGSNAYALSPDGLATVRAIGTLAYVSVVAAFVAKHGRLADRAAAPRARPGGPRVTVTLPGGLEVALSAGAHNDLARAVVTEFLPRFAAGATVLYVGDTADKDAYVDTAALAGLGLSIDTHAKLPDLILLDAKKRWLFLVEAVTSHGPITPQRRDQLAAAVHKVDADPVYLTAFPDRATFRRYAGDIAWETEVWIADNPDHLVHFNGDKFLGPYAGESEA